MAKRKSGTHSGVHKNHGPKRHMFKELKPMIHLYSKYGVLSKYNSQESFILACQARGKKNVTAKDWSEFVALKTKKDKDAYFASLKK